MPRGINLLLLLTALVGGATAQTPPPIDAWERCDGFISSGGNIPGYPAYMTLRDARAACASIPSCRGFTYSGSPDPDTATDVWLKDKWDCNPDGGWGAFKKPPVDAWERCDGFISSGGNIPGYEGAQMTLRDARAACASIPGCRGFTYSGSPDPDTATDVWLKDKWDCNPDGGWGAFKKPPVDAWERCDGFISSGGNIPGYEGAQMTLRDARAACASIPGCRGFTYSGSPDPDTATGVWLKDKWDCNPDGGWGAFKKPEGAGASGCVNRFGNGLDWTAIPYKRLGTDSPWGLVDDCTQQNVSPYGAYLCGVRGPAGDITNCPGDCQAGQCVSGPSGTWERCTGFISAGGNVPGYQGVKLTPNEAQATCASLPSCIGYTYTGSGGADDRTNVWLKEKWDCVQNGGSPPPLYTSVLVKGWNAFKKPGASGCTGLVARGKSISCTTWGDPHVITFAGRNSHPMGEGAYVLASCADLTIHSCHRPIRDGVSVNSAFAIKYGPHVIKILDGAPPAVPSDSGIRVQNRKLSFPGGEVVHPQCLPVPDLCHRWPSCALSWLSDALAKAHGRP